MGRHKQPKPPTTTIQIYPTDKTKLDQLKASEGEYMRDVIHRLLKEKK